MFYGTCFYITAADRHWRWHWRASDGRGSVGTVGRGKHSTFFEFESKNYMYSFSESRDFLIVQLLQLCPTPQACVMKESKIEDVLRVSPPGYNDLKWNSLITPAFELNMLINLQKGDVNTTLIKIIWLKMVTWYYGTSQSLCNNMHRIYVTYMLLLSMGYNNITTMLAVCYE